MTDPISDQAVLDHIQHLVTEEEGLYRQGFHSDAERERLRTLNVALDQAWDLLRQRRALREFGQNPSEAHVRPAEVVEKYSASATGSRLAHDHIIAGIARGGQYLLRVRWRSGT